jgi:plasmid stability protein
MSAFTGLRGIYPRSGGMIGSATGTSAHYAACNRSGLTSIRTETIMVLFAWEKTMPTTLTLKNIPDEVYVRLKASAESHRRSLNSEAIVCLESVLLPGRATAEEVIARARAIRELLPKGTFTAKDIDAFKREGRP